MNPHNLPGIFYICKACEQRHIPSDEVGKRKKNLEQPATTETVTSEETAAPQQPTIAEEMRALIPVSQNPRGNGPRQDSPGPAHVDQDNRRANPTQMCSFYHIGTCRHGISGRGCSKLHPSLC